MFSTSKIRVLLASLLLVAMFGAASGPRVLANSSQSNSVTFTVSGGNVTALATCLNAAKGGGNTQLNDGCTNYAYARGNVIIIKGVTIDGLQTNAATMGNTHQSNSVSFTVNGGNVTAVAACVNAAHGGGNVQINNCVNIAVAIGNIIVLVNVNIGPIQINT
jgi:hypothetical protein